MMSQDLTLQFTAAKQAYPRPVWMGDATWRLVDYPIIPGLLILQELPRGNALGRTHGNYTIRLQDLMYPKAEEGSQTA